MTLFDDAEDALQPYRRTLRFSAQSLIYGMQRRDFQRDRDSPSASRYVLRSTMTLGEFRELFHVATGERLDEDRFQQLASEFDQFAGQFARSARLRPF